MYAIRSYYAIKGVPVTKIGYKALAGTSITSVVLPDSIAYIDNNAFEGCSELLSINIVV